MTIDDAIEQLQALARISGGDRHIFAYGRVTTTREHVTWIKPIGFWEAPDPVPEGSDGLS